MNKKYRKYYLAILFAVVLVLLPTHSANAWWGGIGEFAYGAVVNIFASAAYIMFTIAGNFISFLARGLNTVINIRVYPNGGIAVIDESWKIMRNFANMFFIVALIMMAFATIFNITKYEARALFPKFLISALLINFSLVLGVLVIDASQILSNTFLTSIGDMSARIGQGLNPSSLLPGASDEAFQSALTSGASGVDNTVSGALVQIVFSLILVLTFVFSLLTAFIFSLIRIPILWALLIVSPIAWILNVFPAGQGTYKKWWKLFIGWNMFLPIFLFFLYFGLYFLQSQSVIMAAIANQTKDQDFGTGVPDFFQRLFFYILAAIFLIGGTIVAMKASMFSGTGVVGVATWSRGVAARRLGLTSTGAAVSQRLEQAQKEGLPTRFGQAIFGGERALQLETQRKAARLGVKGALEKGVEIEKEKQKPFTQNVSRLQELSTTGSKEQRLAARGRLTELGALSRQEITDTYQMYGGDRSESANKYINSIDFGKMNTADRQNFSQTLTNIEARKKNALAMIEKDKLDTGEIERLAKQFTNTGEVTEFLEKGKKNNLLSVAKARVNLGIEGAKSIDEEIQKSLKKMTDDQVLEIANGPDFFKSDPESTALRTQFYQTLKNNPKRFENLALKATGDVHKKLGTMAKLSRREQNRPKIEALNKKRQALTPAITQARQDLTNIENQITQLEGQIDPNYPNSSQNAQLRQQIDQLEKQRTAKENVATSLSDKIDKLDERINNVKTGTPGGPATP